MALLMLFGVSGSALASTTPGAVISNGTVMLGVTQYGDLNYDCANAGGSNCPANSAGSVGSAGTSVIGIRYMPLNTDATADGCACEGWGVADAGSGLAGGANESAGNLNITPVSFVSDGTTAVITDDIADGSIPGYGFRVVQDYHPSSVSPNLYEDTVSVTNTGTHDVTDLRFRRAMDWDIEPTAYEEWVTVANVAASRQLLWDSDNGFVDPSPLAARYPYFYPSESICGTNYTGTCAFTDLGSVSDLAWPPVGGVYPAVHLPYDHGAAFDFGFGPLAAGATRSFKTYYGAAPSEASALAAISAQGIGVYSLGEPDCGNTDGSYVATTGLCAGLPAFAGVEQGLPNTFTFGFLTADTDLSVTAAAATASVATAGAVSTTFKVHSSGPDRAPGVHLTIPIPAGLAFSSATASTGSCTYVAPNVVCDLGSFASGADATVALTLTGATVGDAPLVASVSTLANDATAGNNQATTDVTVTAAAPPAPPLAASPAAPGPFMVQVQFRLPATCKLPCKAKAQLTLRDGTTVLGSRSGLSMDGSGHVRFLVPIDKAVLLSAVGTLDAKGYRTTPTRLTVWTRAANGSWTSTVKLGHITVALGRIASGKAPKTTSRVF